MQAAGVGVAAVVGDAAPSVEQLQFARAVFILFYLWPALRKAVEEEWGGHESREKMEFLLSYVCDEFGSGEPKEKPDIDYIAELFENYVIDEYEARLDDDSAIWAASHICVFHDRIFQKHEGEALLAGLEESYAKLGGKTLNATRHKSEHDTDNEDESGDDEPSADGGATEPRAQQEKPEPVIDEDGFELVQPRRRH